MRSRPAYLARGKMEAHTVRESGVSKLTSACSDFCPASPPMRCCNILTTADVADGLSGGLVSSRKSNLPCHGGISNAPILRLSLTLNSDCASVVSQADPLFSKMALSYIGLLCPSQISCSAFASLLTLYFRIPAGLQSFFSSLPRIQRILFKLQSFFSLDTFIIRFYKYICELVIFISKPFLLGLHILYHDYQHEVYCIYPCSGSIGRCAGVCLSHAS